MRKKAFTTSDFSPSIQELCWFSPSPSADPAHQDKGQKDKGQINYVELFSLTDDDIPALLEIAQRYGDIVNLHPGNWDAPVHAWKALSQLSPKKVVPEALELINSIDLTDGDWFNDLHEPLADLAIREPETIPLFLAAMQEDQRHTETRSLILEATRWATVKTPQYQQAFYDILVNQLKEFRIDCRNYYALVVAELAFTEDMTQELKELLRKVCLEGLVNLSVVACNDGLKENVGLDFEEDPALKPIYEEFENIKKILCHFSDRDAVFSRQAILDAKECRERIIPSLIESVRDTTALARYEISYSDNTVTFAVHLLAEFQAKEALPALLDSLSLTEDQCCDYIYGDSLFESIPGMLYRLIGDDFDFYDEKLRDPKTPPVLRARLLSALPRLVKSKTLEEEKFFDLLAEYLRIATDENNEKFATDIVCDLVDSGNPKYWSLAQEAFDKDLVDEVMINRQSTEDYLHGKARFGKAGMERLFDGCDFTDTITELESWRWFQSDQDDDDDDDDDDDYDDEDDEYYNNMLQRYARAKLDRVLHTSAFVDDNEAADDIANRLETNQRIGRNDPCPCGSGKKYKMCCGKN